MNCCLLFDPATDHRGKVDDKNRTTARQYRTKVANLTTLTKDYDIGAAQEAGGRADVAALAQAAGTSWAWSQANDTATGKEVAVLHKLPG